MVFRSQIVRDHPPEQDWRAIAKAASEEPDSKKLVELAKRLVEALDREKRVVGSYL